MRTVLAALIVFTLGCGEAHTVEPGPAANSAVPVATEDSELAEPEIVPEDESFDVDAAEELAGRIGAFEKSGQRGRFTTFRAIESVIGELRFTNLAIHCGSDGTLIRAIAYVDADTYEENQKYVKLAVRDAMMIAMEELSAIQVVQYSEFLSGWFAQDQVQELMAKGGAYWHGGGNKQWKAFAFTTLDDHQKGLLLYPSTSEQPKPYPADLETLGVEK